MNSFSRRGFLHLIPLLLLFVGLVVGTYIFLNHRQSISQLRGVQGAQTSVFFLDNNGIPITTTASTNVKIRLNYHGCEHPVTTCLTPPQGCRYQGGDACNCGQIVCSGNSVTQACAQCIIGFRTDLLPFYQSNGWNISSSNYVSIVNNWCNQVSSQATQECLGVKKQVCQNVCATTTSQLNRPFSLIKPTFASDLVPPANPSLSCNDVTLTITPESSNPNLINLRINGDASTYVGNSYSPSGSVSNCKIDAVSGGQCLVSASGTWTRTWRHCSGSFENCSGICSVSANYNYVSPNTPPSPPPPPPSVPPPATPPASPPPIIPNPNVMPSAFQVSFDQNTINNVTSIRYYPGITIPVVLPGGNGAKTVFVQFLFADGKKEMATATVYLNVPPPPPPPPPPTFITGVNIETITSYGYVDLKKNTQATDVDADLSQLQKMGGSLVRVFIGNNQIQATESARRLGEFLDKAATYDISVIPVFIDFYGGPWDHKTIAHVYNLTACPSRDPNWWQDLGDGRVSLCEGHKIKTWVEVEQELLWANYSSGHNPQGTDQYYDGNLTETFFTVGYKSVFKSFVQTVVNSSKQHPNIYAWEVGNELKASPSVLISFMQDITGTIKSLDPNHKISLGMLRADHTGLTPEQLYSSLPNVDVVTVHAYNGDRAGIVDVQWAKEHRKIALIEEIGFEGNADRSTRLKTEIDYWKSVGATGILPWAFIAKGLADNGDGDESSGFDAIFHTDYDSMFAVMRSFSTRVATATTTATATTNSPVKPPVTIQPQANKSGFDAVQEYLCLKLPFLGFICPTK